MLARLLGFLLGIVAKLSGFTLGNRGGPKIPKFMLTVQGLQDKPSSNAPWILESTLSYRGDSCATNTGPASSV